MRNAASLLALVLLVAGPIPVGVSFGCAGSSPPQASSSSPPAPTRRTPLRGELPLNMPCPLGVEDATVYAEDVPHGVEVTLTSMANVDELRMRAASAAKAYGPMRHRGIGHDGQHGQGNQHGLQLIWLNRVAIRYEDIPAGARLTIQPDDPSELAKVRATVREHVLDIASRPCKAKPALPNAEKGPPPGSDGALK